MRPVARPRAPACHRMPRLAAAHRGTLRGWCLGGETLGVAAVGRDHARLRDACSSGTASAEATARLFELLHLSAQRSLPVVTENLSELRSECKAHHPLRQASEWLIAHRRYRFLHVGLDSTISRFAHDAALS